MATDRFSLADVVAIAKMHPFYDPEIQYPPNTTEIHAALEWTRRKTKKIDICSQPLLKKTDIYKAVERLTHDMSPQNVYRQSSYMTITGGGSGGLPMMFAVDSHENRKQRLQMGELLRLCRLIEPSDWVLSLHMSGGFYRSLDLTTEIMENAEATVLSGGNYMPMKDVASALAHYHVNVITGDASQIIQLVYYISTLELKKRSRIKLTKIIYTSEPLTASQRGFIRTTIGKVKICSIMGSAEAGAWALSNPDLVGEDNLIGNTMDFVFDTRNMIIEILPATIMDSGSNDESFSPLPLGESGIIVQTSLQRLRNPLLRYITGDVGSLHPLPECASSIIPEADRVFLRVLRMHGRDRRFSFKWYGAYFEFTNMRALMQMEENGILQWQVILDQLESSPQSTLEVRLLRGPPRTEIRTDEEVIKLMETFFLVLPENVHLFRVVLVKDLSGFERSSTGGKVVHFVDRIH